MLTPVRSVEEGSSRWVTWCVQPPSSMRLCARSNEYQIGPTSPWSVGGGAFELGFSSSNILFSWAGSLEDWSISASRVCSRSCACAESAEKAAVATAADPAPRKLLRDTFSTWVEGCVSGFIVSLPLWHVMASQPGFPLLRESECMW